MTAPIAKERFKSRDGTVDFQAGSTSESQWVVYADNDLDARIAIVEQIPAINSFGQVVQKYGVEEVGGGIWYATIYYGFRQPRKTGSSLFGFDTGGGQQLITNSLSTQGKFAPSGKTAPDCKGAIGVTKDSVEGVNITVPTFNWNTTFYMDARLVTQAYILGLFACTGCKNGAAFKGFNPAECLFLGCTGSMRDQGDYELNFKFSSSPNLQNITIGEITVNTKRGWDYLWIKYQDSTDQSILIKKPIAAYVEEVYPDADFSQLGIGV